MASAVDQFLSSIVKTFTTSIKSFVAFLFFVFSAGMLFGLFISKVDAVFLFLPPLLGLVAYYNEKVALLAFAALVVFFI